MANKYFIRLKKDKNNKRRYETDIVLVRTELEEYKKIDREYRKYYIGQDLVIEEMYEEETDISTSHSIALMRIDWDDEPESDTADDSKEEIDTSEEYNIK